MSYIVSVEWLKESLEPAKDDLVIIDARYDLNDPKFGKQAYEKGHIPGAVHLDLKKDLSGKVMKHGGSHPLPPIDLMAKKLSKIGVDHATTVVIYDQDNDMYAARAWWMLHYLGHEQIFVLDGGFKRWVEKGYPVTTEDPKLSEKAFHPQPIDIVVHVDGVKKKLQEASAILIDSRSKERYLGKEEPLYTKAGHIPGAKNFFWKDVFNENGLWKSEASLKEHFSALPKDEEIIVSCGSGVSACPNYIGLKMAGFHNVKLYPGSFSDWISYEDHEVSKKEE